MKQSYSPLKNREPTSACCAPAAYMRSQPANVRPTCIASILRPSSAEDDGDGPYLDLEFSIPKENDVDDVGSTIGSDCDDMIRPDILISTTSSKPQLASSLLKSATRFRVFMLRFKKSSSKSDDSSPKKQNSKLLVKVEEVFSRHATMQSPALSSDDKKTHPGDVIHKYLNKIKPFYIRASKRCGDKHQINASSDWGLKTVSNRLRKSRSVAVAAVMSPPVMQQDDAIESAIAHCKRSFNAGKGSDLGLARCMSDPGAERDAIN